MNPKIFLALALLGMSTSAISATSGSLNLKGKVEKILSISVTPAAGADLLDLSASQTDLNVAQTLEKSNSNTGYKVTVSSLNNGKLLRDTGTETLTYTAKYNSTTLNLTNSNAVPVTGKSVSASGIYSATSNFTISYTGIDPTTMVAGDYSDTVTFTIAAN